MKNDFIQGKTVLVTGSTDGIGLETAKQLAEMGAHVLLHGRDKGKGVQAVKKITQATCYGSVDLYLADFSSFKQVKRLADEISRENNALHGLINNAGNFYNQRYLNESGFEMTFAVNYLAPFLLTMLLLDLLKTSAPARIVNVASSAHRIIQRIDFENLQGEKRYDPFEAYALSKLGNVLFSNALAERLKSTHVTVNALHPGVVATKLLKKSYDLDGISAADGAATSVKLAAGMDVAKITGKYFRNAQQRQPSDVAMDEKNQEKMWKITREMLGRYLE